MPELSISYNKLWKLLIDKKMSQADLRRAAGFSTQTLGRLRRDEPSTTVLLMKICACLDCDIGDICGFIKAEESVGDANAGESK